MISLENAKRLKELGVCFEAPGYLRYLYDGTLTDVFIPKSLREERHWWVPDLEQLIDEVEKLEYGSWEMDYCEERDKPYYFRAWLGATSLREWGQYAQTKEDAVALALIEIYEGEKG